MPAASAGVLSCSERAASPSPRGTSTRSGGTLTSGASLRDGGRCTGCVTGDVASGAAARVGVVRNRERRSTTTIRVGRDGVLAVSTRGGRRSRVGRRCAFAPGGSGAGPPAQRSRGTEEAQYRHEERNRAPQGDKLTSVASRATTSGGCSALAPYASRRGASTPGRGRRIRSRSSSVRSFTRPVAPPDRSAPSSARRRATRRRSPGRRRRLLPRSRRASATTRCSDAPAAQPRAQRRLPGPGRLARDLDRQAAAPAATAGDRLPAVLHGRRSRCPPRPTTRPRSPGSPTRRHRGCRPEPATRRSTRRTALRARRRRRPAPSSLAARAPGSGGRRRPRTASRSASSSPVQAAADEKALFACDVVPSSPELPTLVGEAVLPRAAAAATRRALAELLDCIGSANRPARCRTAVRAPGCRRRCSRTCRRLRSGSRSVSSRPGCRRSARRRRVRLQTEPSFPSLPTRTGRGVIRRAELRRSRRGECALIGGRVLRRDLDRVAGGCRLRALLRGRCTVQAAAPSRRCSAAGSRRRSRHLRRERVTSFEGLAWSAADSAAAPWSVSPTGWPAARACPSSRTSEQHLSAAPSATWWPRCPRPPSTRRCSPATRSRRHPGSARAPRPGVRRIDLRRLRTGDGVLTGRADWSDVWIGALLLQPHDPPAAACVPDWFVVAVFPAAACEPTAFVCDTLPSFPGLSTRIGTFTLLAPSWEAVESAAATWSVPADCVDDWMPPPPADWPEPGRSCSRCPPRPTSRRRSSATRCRRCRGSGPGSRCSCCLG